MPKPHILILDPTPQRDSLIEQIHQLGYPVDVAQGLHDAMVQSIIRKPVLIIADLTTADACGDACQQRLEQVPHLALVPFLKIDSASDSDDPQAAHQTILDMIGSLLPSLEPPAATAADHRPELGSHPASPQPVLADLLEQLAAQGADATVAITDADHNYSEILVRNGVAIHAVVDTGLTGPDAMDAITAMDTVEVSVGQAPHPDTPHTLVTGPTEGDPSATDTTLPDTPEATHVSAGQNGLDEIDSKPQEKLSKAGDTAAQELETPAPDRAEVLTLLNELAAFGIVTQGPS